jgi:outer membrane protein TolC
MVGIRREQAEQAYLDYQKTVIGSFKDVEDALIRISTERQRNRTLRSALADASRSVDAVDARYRSGLVDLSALLAAQRQMLQIQDSLAISDGALRTNLASLYKALGGGWSDGETVGSASAQGHAAVDPHQ